MTSASSLRVQIESALAHKIPSALTPRARVVRPTTPTGIDAVDALLEGGPPVGALTEIVGPEGSGRTSLALSSIAQLTAAGIIAAENGADHRRTSLKVHRQRFMQQSNVIPMKKPLTKVTTAEWETHAAWAGRR